MMAGFGNIQIPHVAVTLVLVGADWTTTRRLELLLLPSLSCQGSFAEILAGLGFVKGIIRQLFREDIMRESVIYQDILQQVCRYVLSFVLNAASITIET